jgi:hypothetical protein
VSFQAFYDFFYQFAFFLRNLIIVSDPEVDADVEDDDDEDENDVAHEPDVDLLEVTRLGKVLLDRGQQTRQNQKTRQGSHKSAEQTNYYIKAKTFFIKVKNLIKIF